MKLLKYILACLLVISCQENKKEVIVKKTTLIPSKIDSLNTEAEVQQFIRENDVHYNKFELRKIADFNRTYRVSDEDSLIKILAKKMKVDKSFYKADIDNNGYSDLVAIGDNYKCTTSNQKNETVSCDFSVFAVMNFGKYSTRYKDLKKDYRETVVPKVDEVNGIPVLSVANVEYTYDSRTKKRGVKDTLTVLAYKYGGFVEYQKQSTIHSIEKIEFSASACFGRCPIFKIEMRNDRKTVLWAKEYNFNISFPESAADFRNLKELKGKYDSTITNDKYNEIVGLINYLNIEGLKKDYMTGGTCQPSSELKITYDNGKVKTIGDYGINGTRGLNRLYEMLFDLRFNQKWKLLSKELDIEIY